MTSLRKQQYVSSLGKPREASLGAVGITEYLLTTTSQKHVGKQLTSVGFRLWSCGRNLSSLPS